MTWTYWVPCNGPMPLPHGGAQQASALKRFTRRALRHTGLPAYGKSSNWLYYPIWIVYDHPSSWANIVLVTSNTFDCVWLTFVRTTRFSMKKVVLLQRLESHFDKSQAISKLCCHLHHGAIRYIRWPSMEFVCGPSGIIRWFWFGRMLQSRFRRGRGAAVDIMDVEQWSWIIYINIICLLCWWFLDFFEDYESWGDKKNKILLLGCTVWW